MAYDLLFAFRSLRKNLVFSLTVLVTLALGVGANTAIFSVLHSVVLRSLPYPHSERIVRLYEYSAERDIRYGAALPNFLDWKQQATSFDIMEAFSMRFRALEDDPESRISILGGGPALLELIGVRPIVGRLIQQDDLVDGPAAVTVITHQMWVGRFASDPEVVGRTVRFGTDPYTVVGVATPITGPLFSRIRAIVPWQPTYRPQARGGRGGTRLARLREGVTQEEAQAELDVIAAGLLEQYPEMNAGWAPLIVPLYEETVSGIRPMLLALFGATVLILLIAVANIANLFLARGMSRQAELSVRAALGAGFGRLTRLLVAESMLLTLLGGLAGVALGWALVRLLLSESPNWIPRLSEIAVDPLVLLAAVAVTLFSGLLSGLTPLWALTRGSLQGGIQLSGHGQRQDLDRSWLRSGLVIAQLALALVLLTGSGLMIRSFVALQNVPLGVDFNQIVTFTDGWMSVGMSREDVMPDFQRRTRLLEHIEAIPGVIDVTLTSQAPLSGGWGANDVEVLTGSARGRSVQVDLIGVTPDFFPFFDSRALEGRLFQSSDQAAASPVVVVDSNLAKAIWGDESAVGQRLKLRETELEVIGVSQAIRYGDLAGEMRPKLYNLIGLSGAASGGTFLIRHEGEAEAIMPAIEARVKEVDPSARLTNLQPLEAIYDRYLRQPRFYLTLIVSLGALALIVAAVGVFGVVSYSVGRRTSEVGIRMALGADSAGIVALFSRRTVRFLAVGLATGAVASLWLTRYLESLLFEVEPTDPVALVAMAVTLTVISMIATLIPTRRALKVDPATALRAE